MKKRSFLKNEDGAVAVLVAVSLTVLLGISAVAIDYGRLAFAHQSLQNAADAAALAAAADLGAKKTQNAMADTARKYCTANDCNPADEDIRGTMQTGTKTVTIRLEKDLDMGFSSVLTGEQSRTVSAEATAEVISIFGDCPYAMFAGQRIEDNGIGITVTGNDITINGNIHSNSDINMKNAVLGEGAIATAVRKVSPASEGWNANSIALDMPSFKSFESALNKMTDVVEFQGNVVKNKDNGFQSLIDDAVAQYHASFGGNTSYLYSGLYIHIRGGLTFNGHASSAYTPRFPIILIVDGDIDLNGAPINSTRDYPLAIMSKDGNITVNGGGATYTGILYAPKGDITLNGNDARFVGMIVGNNIRKSGGKIIVSYYENADKYLPPTKVHLIN